MPAPPPPAPRAAVHLRSADLRDRDSPWHLLLDRLDCGIAIYDPEARLVTCNGEFRHQYRTVAEHIVPGLRFGELLRRVVDAGLVPQARGREAEWIAARERDFGRSDAPLERQMADGRWRRICESRLADGGVMSFSTDITELVEKRRALQQTLEAARTAHERLDAAIDALPDGFALFDADDRLVLCNARFRELYRESAQVIEPGVRFEALLRHGLARGQYPQAAGQEEAWLAARLQRHREPQGPLLQQLPGNRWLRIDERVTRDGGIAGVRTEVTELVRREQQLTELNAELAAARARLEQLSETDALTGIANRRRFDRRFTEEWSRVVRHGTALGLLLVDIDHFKPYNDRHGHPAGDDCLRRVAALLDGCAGRPTDVVARYGGEEFALLLPHMRRDAVGAVAQRCVDAVDAAALAHGASPVAAHVTVSVGMAWAERGEGAQGHALLATADGALYRAKAAGRHRVEGAA